MHVLFVPTLYFVPILFLLHVTKLIYFLYLALARKFVVFVVFAAHKQLAHVRVWPLIDWFDLKCIVLSPHVDQHRQIFRCGRLATALCGTPQSPIQIERFTYPTDVYFMNTDSGSFKKKYTGQICRGWCATSGECLRPSASNMSTLIKKDN